MSLQVINEDMYSPAAVYAPAPGAPTVAKTCNATREKTGASGADKFRHRQSRFTRDAGENSVDLVQAGSKAVAYPPLEYIGVRRVRTPLQLRHPALAPARNNIPDQWAVVEAEEMRLRFLVPVPQIPPALSPPE